MQTSTTRGNRKALSGSGLYPTPNGGQWPENRLPNDPNFPWGGDSPVHRHQNTTELSEGVAQSQGAGWLKGLGSAVRKLETALGKLSDTGEQ